MSKFTNLAPRIMRDLLAEPHFGFAVLDAAAVVGNLAYETGGFDHMQEMKPTVKGSAGGYGWAQWTGPRRRAFEAWAKRNGWHLDSYEANYSFLIRELLTTEKKALDAVKKAKGINAKTKAFENGFERAGVKAYTKRYAWAKKALEAYQGAAQPVPTPVPSPAPQPEPAFPAPPASRPAPPPPPVVADPPPSVSWLVRLMAWLGLLKPPAAMPRVHKVAPGGADSVVRHVQTQLQALGYAEVGLADGYMGGKTEAAIRAFAADNGMQSDGQITDLILAAIPKAKPRPVAENRANVTARDLRHAGNEQAIAFNGLGWLGNLIGLGGVLGGVEQTGVLDSLRDTATSASSTLSTVQSGLIAIVAAIQWCVSHWWLFAILAGLWTVYRVTLAVLNLVVLFRQGILQRASFAPGAGGLQSR